MGDMVTFVPRPGYYLKGSFHLKCLPPTSVYEKTGNWNSSQPQTFGIDTLLVGNKKLFYNICVDQKRRALLHPQRSTKDLSMPLTIQFIPQ